MNDLISVENMETMSSSELAILLGREIQDVNKSIRQIFQEKIVTEIISVTLRKNGQVLNYHLPELEAKMFVAKKDINYLEKITQFWIDKNNTQDVIPSTKKEKIDLELLGAEYASRMLNWSKASTLEVIHKIYENHNVNTNMLPIYTRDVKATFSAKDLLKKNECGVSSIAFNKLMIAGGFMEIAERTGSKGQVKTFKVLTETGLDFGQNDTSKHNPRETQAHYFEDSFMELFSRLTKEE